MVATPRFHVTQDAAWVFVHVHVPFVRVSEMEFYVDGLDFTFYCKPYLLKLHFPHEVVDDELAKAVYDPNKVRQLWQWWLQLWCNRFLTGCIDSRRTMAPLWCICPRRSLASTSRTSTCSPSYCSRSDHRWM